MKSDIEIARSATLQPIDAIARRLEIPGSAVQHYGRSIGKIDFDFLQTQYDKRDGQLILVTAISPTPAGEGKTTTTVGLGDALNRIGKRTIVCLREPSLGPCFGMKGGGRRRRVCAGRAYGFDQLTFHGRLSRNHLSS